MQCIEREREVEAHAQAEADALAEVVAGAAEAATGASAVQACNPYPRDPRGTTVQACPGHHGGARVRELGLGS